MYTPIDGVDDPQREKQLFAADDMLYPQSCLNMKSSITTDNCENANLHNPYVSFLEVYSCALGLLMASRMYKHWQHDGHMNSCLNHCPS